MKLQFSDEEIAKAKTLNDGISKLKHWLNGYVAGTGARMNGPPSQMTLPQVQIFLQGLVSKAEAARQSRQGEK